VGFTAKIVVTFRSCGVLSEASLPDAFEIVAEITDLGFSKISFLSHL